MYKENVVITDRTTSTTAVVVVVVLSVVIMALFCKIYVKLNLRKKKHIVTFKCLFYFMIINTIHF